MNPELAREFRQIKDRLDLLERGRGEVGRWQDWTPTVTQSVSVTFTNTFARYIVIQKLVFFRARLGVTSAGTTGNAVIIGGLPFSFASVSGHVGTIRILDSGTGNYVGILAVNTATSVVGVADGLANVIGITPNFALASGDTITVEGAYEGA